jgi:hypothetical protein
VPKVSDFGLAKKLDEQGRTQPGTVMGTPEYVAPEQAAGSNDVGVRADVYSLGAILYECLTGRPPFRAASPTETLLQVLHQEPPAPRSLNAAVPRELETIALKCLSKEPEKRYASAAALADDLGRYLAGEPIQARPVGGVERAAKWVRRNPAMAAMAAAIFVTLTAAAVVSALFGLDSRKQMNEAHRQTKIAEANERLAIRETNEAREERDRARFYLSYFLDLRRFGRTLSAHPLRSDFEVKLHVTPRGESAPLTRSAIKDGLFDRSKPFDLAIEADEDCHVALFYALPDRAAELKGLAKYVLVFPNAVEQDNRVRKGSKRVVLNDPRIFFAPYQVAPGEVAYLYLLATTKEWSVEGDEKVSLGSRDPRHPILYGFSEKRASAVAEKIKGLVEGRGVSPGRVAEEIFVFNVQETRPDR